MFAVLLENRLLNNALFRIRQNMINPLQLVTELNIAGLACIPIVPGTKRPTCKISRFFESGPTAMQLPLLFHSNVEVAILSGAPSDRLAIIDCDNMTTATQMLDGLGHPNTWIVKTSRGIHIYTRTPVTVKSTRGDGFDLQASKKYCLAPGAQHPSGITYEFLNKPNQIIELPTLDSIPGVVLQPATLRPNNLPRHTWKLLTNSQAWQAESYDSRSDAEQAILIGLINVGFDYERTLATFAHHAHHDTHFKNLIRDRGVREAEAWLKRSYDSAIEYARTHNNPELRLVAQLRSLISRQVWTGRAGSYNRAVLLGHIAIAERAGRLSYQAGVRELAERAGMSLKAISKANARLCKDHFIEATKPAYGTLATQWRLNVGALSKGNTPNSPSVRECVLMTTRNQSELSAHDLFRWAGLGKGAAQIWELLVASDHPHSAQSVCAKTGRGLKSVYRILGKMHQLEMLTGDFDGSAFVWLANRDVNLDEVAQKLNVAGIGSRQRTEHAREREMHRRVISRLQNQIEPREDENAVGDG
jgi:hypothetical protein